MAMAACVMHIKRMSASFVWTSGRWLCLSRPATPAQKNEKEKNILAAAAGSPGQRVGVALGAASRTVLGVIIHHLHHHQREIFPTLEQTVVFYLMCQLAMGGRCGQCGQQRRRLRAGGGYNEQTPASSMVTRDRAHRRRATDPYQIHFIMFLPYVLVLCQYVSFYHRAPEARNRKAADPVS